MDKKKAAETFSWMSFTALVILFVLLLSGSVTSGTGLGDLGFLFQLGGIALAYLIYYSIANRKNTFTAKRFFNWGMILFVIALYFIYCFSVGRGAEHPWDGSFFV